MSNSIFPIQGTRIPYGGEDKDKIDLPKTEIPMWLAAIAHKEYDRQCGTGQLLKRMKERGGFDRVELLMLLRKVDVFSKKEIGEICNELKEFSEL